MLDQATGLPMNPDEIPTDPAEIEKMLAGEAGTDGKQEGEAIEAEPEGASSGAESKEQQQDQPSTEAKTGEEKPDDKLVPIGAVYAERDKARRERQARAEAEAKANALQERLDAMAKGETPPTEGEALVSDDDLAAMEEDFPALAKIVKGQMAHIRAMEAKLREVTAHETQQRKQDDEELNRKVQGLIDQNPVLSYWQNEDPDMWAEAIAMDDKLRGNPKLAGLTMEQRFEKVVQLVTGIHGEPELPPEYAVGAKSTPAPKPDQQEPTPKARAAKIAQAAGEPSLESLTDLPGGTPPASGDHERMDQMPAHALTHAFMSMTREQQDAALAKLG